MGKRKRICKGKEPWYFLVRGKRFGGLWPDNGTLKPDEMKLFLKYSVGPFLTFTKAKKEAIKRFPEREGKIKQRRKFTTQTCYPGPSWRFVKGESPNDTDELFI